MSDYTACEMCDKPMRKGEKYVLFPKGDLDLHGIWFGDVKSYLWFKDEKFCGADCMIEYVKKWHAGAKARMENQ